MGETDKPQGDVKTSEAKKGQTPETAETFTQKQVDALVTKAKGDATADYKRLESQFKTSQSVGEAALKRLKDVEEANLNRELEVARDDPDRIRDIQRRQRDSIQRAEDEEKRRRFDVDKADVDERLKRAEAIERKDNAKEVAEKRGVDWETLNRFCSDRDSMEELAKTLPKVGIDQSGQQADQTTRMTTPPDSGKTKGIGGQKLEDLVKVDTSYMTREQLLEHKQALQNAVKAQGGTQ